VTTFRDLHGREHERPANAPLDWRVSCYTVALRDGLLLVTEPVWSTKWELPGGRVDVASEESIVGAATRECLEETGFVLAPDHETLQLVTENFFCFPKYNRYYHALAFVVRGTVTNEEPLSEPDPVEIKRIAWVDPAALTGDTTQWMHFAALRRLGIAP
jgi:8-oxo-dGTP pyrophosphatase MutT (NUDIX family)